MERYRVIVRGDPGSLRHPGIVFDETYDDFDVAKDKIVEMLMEYGETYLVDLEFLREGDE